MKPKSKPPTKTTQQFRPNTTSRIYSNPKYTSTNKQASQTHTIFPSIHPSTPKTTSSFNQAAYPYEDPKPYWEKEKLFDTCIKLQQSVNLLDKTVKIQRIENKKQKEEIQKQNKILNEYNEKFNQEENKNDEPRKTNKNITLIQKESSGPFNYDKTKRTTRTNVNANPPSQNAQDINVLTKQTLVSNLKIKYRELNNEYKAKEEEIKNIKNEIKTTKVTELESEISSYEKEMIKLRNKLGEALEKITMFEMKEKKYKTMHDLMDFKKKRIRLLEQERDKITEIYEEKIAQMENELKQKQKTIDKYKIQQQGEMNAKRHYELEMERHKHFCVIPFKK